MEEEKEQIKTSGEIVLEVSGGDVTSLSWEYGETFALIPRADMVDLIEAVNSIVMN